MLACTHWNDASVNLLLVLLLLLLTVAIARHQRRLEFSLRSIQRALHALLDVGLRALELPFSVLQLAERRVDTSVHMGVPVSH